MQISILKFVEDKVKKENCNMQMITFIKEILMCDRMSTDSGCGNGEDGSSDVLCHRPWG